MSSTHLTAILTEIRQLREQTLAELMAMDEGEFGLATDMERWTEVRRVLLRFGDQMREHSTQIRGTRVAIDRAPTMPQLILAEAELA